MIESRPVRPALATIICIWEILVVVVPISGRLAIRLIHHASFDAHPIATSQLHFAGTIVSYILAIAAAIALWQMMRAAYIFLAARFSLELVWFVVAFLRPASEAETRHPEFVWLVRLFALAMLAFNAAIAWYAYKATTPKIEAAPIAAAAPIVPTVRTAPTVPANGSTSVSKFYLATEEDQRKSK